MSDLFIPFNHQPVSTSRGTGTFTCGSGKYARVRIQVSGAAYGVAAVDAASAASYSTSDSFCDSFDVWVNDGDTISFSTSVASATTGSVTSGTASGNSSVTVNYNGSAIAAYRCYAAAGHSVGSPATSTINGSADAYWYAEEYNELT